MQRTNVLQLHKTQETYAKIKELASVAHENVDLRVADDFVLNGVHSVNRILGEILCENKHFDIGSR